MLITSILLFCPTIRTISSSLDMFRYFGFNKFNLIVGASSIGSYREIAIAIESEAGDSLT